MTLFFEDLLNKLDRLVQFRSFCLNIHNREMYISVEFILFNPLRILAIDMIIVNLVFQII